MYPSSLFLSFSLSHRTEGRYRPRNDRVGAKDTSKKQGDVFDCSQGSNVFAADGEGRKGSVRIAAFHLSLKRNCCSFLTSDKEIEAVIYVNMRSRFQREREQCRALCLLRSSKYFHVFFPFQVSMNRASRIINVCVPELICLDPSLPPWGITTQSPFKHTSECITPTGPRLESWPV